jgi:hypothetical protein
VRRFIFVFAFKVKNTNFKKHQIQINKWNYLSTLLGDNTDFPDDIFIIHLDYPRFIINKDDEVEFMEGRRS